MSPISADTITPKETHVIMMCNKIVEIVHLNVINFLLWEQTKVQTFKRF